MRIFNLVISFFTIFSVSNVLAVEPVSDHQVMLYYEIPFGESNQLVDKHKFGLRYDRTMQDPRGFSDINSVIKKPAVLDLQFKHKEQFALKIHGIDYTNRLYVQRADAGDAAGSPAEDATQQEAAQGSETTAETTEATESATETTTTTDQGQEAEKKDEKTVVQKKLDSLPIGVVIGVALGIGILAGVGG